MSLLLSILSSTGIFILFKLIDNYKINTPSVITINYLSACLLGYFIHPFQVMQAVQADWFPHAFTVGFFFIVFFFIIAKSTQKVGIGISTIAAKMSVITPILFSFFFFDESLSMAKALGIPLALIGVFFSIYTKSDKKGVFNKNLYLPIILFIGLGMVDSLVKYTQDKYISNQASTFSSCVFAISFLLGTSYLILSKNTRTLLQLKTYLFGILLGTVNLGSIYFFITSLNDLPMDASVIFGINNIGIVCFSVLIGHFVFKESLQKSQIIGLSSAISAIFILHFF